MAREWMDVPKLPDSDLEKRLHLERYEYAASVLHDQRVLDCACGMGYGTKILSKVCDPMGWDTDPEAILLAMNRYPTCRFWLASLHDPKDGYDALVCFETLEHLTDPERVLKGMSPSIKTMIASVPIRPTVGQNPAHRSDFTPDSFRALISTKFKIVYERPQLWPDGEPMYLMLHGVAQ